MKSRINILNVVTLLEDGEKTKLNEVENAIIEILKLQEEINMICVKRILHIFWIHLYIISDIL